MMAICFAVFNDLVEFDLVTLTWAYLSAVAIGLPPKPTCSHGFSFASNRLFIHGGTDTNGKILIVVHSHTSFSPVQWIKSFAALSAKSDSLLQESI